MNTKQDELFNRLQKDLLKDFPEKYEANVRLLKDILTFKYIVHPTAVMSSYFSIVSGLTAESFYTDKNSSTTLYNISIAGTGTGKDMAVDLVPMIFGAVENKASTTTTDIGFEVVNSKVTSVAGLDSLFKKKRMILYVLDEFGDALGKMQGGGHAGELTAKFKELYSSTNKSYKSIVYARSNISSNDSFTRDYPCFILTGLTTKEQLLTRLKRSMLHDGFLNRFIIMDGSDLKPYIDNDFEFVANDQFKDAIEFYEKVKKYPNTPIPMSNEAKEYYRSIGSPYETGTDIYRFCIENEDEEFETNASTANRWRENALRLATAITTYEYGVNNSASDIYEFQYDSFESRQDLLKGTPLEEYKGSEDYVSEIIRTEKEKYKLSDGSLTKDVAKNLDDIESEREFYNKLFNKAEVDSKIRRLTTLVEQLNGIGYKDIINLRIETADEGFLIEALKEIFLHTDPSKREDIVQYILKNKSKKAKKRINDALNSNKEIMTEVIVENSFIPAIFVEKDILEWSYNFIKEQSIKFYEIFHTEVGQSQHNIKKYKLIKWFKKNQWYKQSDLSKSYVYSKLCTPREREAILEDLIELEILEFKEEESTGTYKNTKYYRLKN